MQMQFKTTLTKAGERMLFDKNYREFMIWLKNSYPKKEAQRQFEAQVNASILKTLIQLGLIHVIHEDAPGNFDILIEFSLDRFDMGMQP